MNKKLNPPLKAHSDFKQNKKDVFKKTEQSEEDFENHKQKKISQHSGTDDQGSEKQKIFNIKSKNSVEYPIVEFEEFNFDRKIISQPKYNLKKKFNIEVPDARYQPSCDNIEKEASILKQYTCKEPPAPSKGSTKSKVFVFPTGSIENSQKPTKILDNQKKAEKGQYEMQESLEQKVQQKQVDIDLLKIKEKYQKEILIKDAQIQLMQKIITDNFLRIKHQKSYSELERIIVEKDAKYAELIKKIQDLTNIIKIKNKQLVFVRSQNSRMQVLIENMKNNQFVNLYRQSNQKLTQQFYKKNVDKQRNSCSWQDTSTQQNCIRSIEDLQKRLEYLKSNRIELEISKSRKKNKSNYSDIIKDQNTWCSQTSKNKNKINFDFKLNKQRAEYANNPIQKSKFKQY